jgi:hypothetical protein
VVMALPGDPGPEPCLGRRGDHTGREKARHDR